MKFNANKSKETRNTLGLTQEELAEKANVNLRTIQRIENNKNIPRVQTLDLICNVLGLETKDLFSYDTTSKQNIFSTKLANFIFLVIINLILVGIIGYLTLDINANMNSKFGGILLSFFLPFFIVALTREMQDIDRLFKFGTGYFLYFLAVIIIHGWIDGFIIGLTTGLFLCLLINVSVLYCGSKFFKKEID